MMEVILICGNRSFGKQSVIQQLVKHFELDSMGIAVGYAYYFNDQVMAVFNGSPLNWRTFKNFTKSRKVVMECTKFETVKFWRSVLPGATVIKIVGNETQEVKNISAKYNVYDTDVAFKTLLEVLKE